MITKAQAAKLRTLITYAKYGFAAAQEAGAQSPEVAKTIRENARKRDARLNSFIEELTNRMPLKV